MASISSALIANRRNRAGRSVASSTGPFASGLAGYGARAFDGTEEVSRATLLGAGEGCGPADRNRMSDGLPLGWTRPSAGVGGDTTGAGADASTGTAGVGAVAAALASPTPTSISIRSSPTMIFWPASANHALIVPAAGERTSTVTLSVSTVARISS
eukprot:scaffold152908_cov35-Tisochrysis_lutea.AAC.2